MNWLHCTGKCQSDITPGAVWGGHGGAVPARRLAPGDAAHTGQAAGPPTPHLAPRRRRMDPVAKLPAPAVSHADALHGRAERGAGQW